MGRKPVPPPPPPAIRQVSKGGPEGGQTGRQWRHQQNLNRNVYSWKKVTTLQWMKDFRDSFTKFQYPFKPICKCCFWSFGYYPDMVSKDSLQRYVSRHPIQHRKVSNVADPSAGFHAGVVAHQGASKDTLTPSEKGMFDGKSADAISTASETDDGGGKKSKKKKKKGKDDDTSSLASGAESEASSVDEQGKKKKGKKKKKKGDGGEGDDTVSVSTAAESKKGKKKKKKGGGDEEDDTQSMSTVGGESKKGGKKKKKKNDDGDDDGQSVSTAAESEGGTKKKKKKKKK